MPAAAPGSTSAALPSASVTASPLPRLAPKIVKRTVRPAYGASVLSRAVAVKATGTPCGLPALGGTSCSAAGTALRTVNAKLARSPGASGAVR